MKKVRIFASIEKRQYKRELLMNKTYIDCIGLAHRVEQEVPEIGDFEKVKGRFEYQIQQLGMAKGWLEVYQPPVGIEGREWMRALDLVVYKDGSVYVCRRMLKCGTKQDILDILNDKDIIGTITSAVPVMLSKI